MRMMFLGECEWVSSLIYKWFSGSGKARQKVHNHNTSFRSAFAKTRHRGRHPAQNGKAKIVYLI
jgi:hypothetical protein